MEEIYSSHVPWMFSISWSISDNNLQILYWVKRWSSPCASLVKHYAMKTSGSRGIAPLFLTSALDGGERSASSPGLVTLGTHCIKGWVGPRTGVDTVEKKTPYTAGNKTPAVQPVARHYTDWDIPTSLQWVQSHNILPSFYIRMPICRTEATYVKSWVPWGNLRVTWSIGKHALENNSYKQTTEVSNLHSLFVPNISALSWRPRKVNSAHIHV
jgi:hypothetical protein